MVERPTAPTVLRLLQINVGKGGPSHDIALQLAYKDDYDIILIQEPWIYSDRTRRLTKKHQAYTCYSPTEDWTNRPRVLTYVKKSPFLRAYTLLGSWGLSRDLLLVQLIVGSLTLQILNVYNAPVGSVDEGEGLGKLLQWTPPLRSFIGGDFNLKHPAWQPSYPSPSTEAVSLVNWTEGHHLHLTLPIGAYTRGYNTIDLTWASSELVTQGISSEVADLPSPSDHDFIYITIHLPTIGSPINPPRFRYDTLAEEDFKEALKGLSSSLDSFLVNQFADPFEPIEANQDLLPLDTLLSYTPSYTQLDSLAQELVKQVYTALLASTKRSYPRGKGQAWWNNECKEAVKDLHKARRLLSLDSPQVAQAQKDLRKVVRRAKREFWLKRLDSLKEGKDVFQAVRWGRSIGSYTSPPLQDPITKQLFTKQEEKEEILVKALLERNLGRSDVGISLEIGPYRDQTLPFPRITQHEVFQSLIRTQSTTLGLDEIPTKVWKLAWPLLEKYIVFLYSKCLELGYHPIPFRTATLVTIPKPGKKDYASPRSYRLIALLSVLGKGIERLVAKRLAWVAIKHKILHPQQFGALFSRSATDLTAVAVHDIENALLEGLEASLLTTDIEGAFDAVLPGRLIQRLQQQGWPKPLVSWAYYFTLDRTAMLRLDGVMGSSRKIPPALPQGSPASPVLFLLYTEPLLKTIGPIPVRNRYSYADDLALLAISKSLERNVMLLEEELGLIN